MSNAINGINFDGSSVRLRWNMSALGGVVKLALPEVTMKDEMMVLLGEQTPSVRTPGILEIGKATGTLTAVGAANWLASLPNEFMNIEFPITGNQRHFSVPFSYGVVLDRCRITKWKPSEWGNDEKNATVEVELSPMNVLVRGRDGKFKSAGRLPGADPLASEAARALMF